MKIYLWCFALLSVLLICGCGTQSKLAKKADEAYENGEYFKAIDLYEKAIEKTKSKEKIAERTFLLAECYRLVNNSRKAESTYRKAGRKKYSDPITLFWEADQARENGDFSDARIVYEEYLAKRPGDERALLGFDACSLATVWMENPTRYVVDNLKDINSREDDFCPAIASVDGNTIYFSSTRENETTKKISDITGKVFSDVFEARLDRQGNWSDPVPMQDTSINSPFDDGAVSMTADKGGMYFTSCKKEPAKVLGCQIFRIEQKGGEWAGLKSVPVVADTVSVGHPSISADGLTLYFASRMQGGMGGSDIWYVERNSSTAIWGTPINAGPSINTPGDEMYPFIRDDGNLYFSSDYWLGMGGLDIFRAIKDDAGFWNVNNMQYPINSEKDDFGIVFDGSKEKGYFSSARKGKGGDDIYSFLLPDLEFYVEGKIEDKASDEPIANASIKLYGSDGSLKETTSRPDGTYKIALQQYTDYIVLCAADQYLKKKVRVSTRNLTDNQTFVENIALVSTQKPVEIPNVFYDFGEFHLNDESKKALDELILLLEDNPNITIELGSHTDMIGDSAKNMKLSLKRAESVINYINEKGYDPDRLHAKGYGENLPVVLTEKLALLDTAFVAGRVLNEEFISSLKTEEAKEKANQINRRTELRILSTNYIPKPEYFIKYRQRNDDAF